MGGWNDNYGEIKKYIATEDEIWSLANFFFSSSCKKTSTYKFGFFKAILDSLFSGTLSNRGYELSYRTLFECFAENYWNLITKYHLKQMRNNGSSDYSSLEIVINSICEKKFTIATLEFSSLAKEDKESIVREVSSKCKKNVVGAMYSNFEGVLYGYGLKEDGIWLNPVAYEFLLKHKFELEKLNYFAWAKYLEEINSERAIVKVLDKLEEATPKRHDLSFYRDILRNEFETNTCFYCGKKLSSSIAVDHIIPWKLVREDRIWNFVLSCKSCNSKKSDRVPEKKKMIKVLERNEQILLSSEPMVIQECKGYSAEMFMRLWQYAKIGGYKEFSYES